jgi:hypothetical protein
MSSRARAARTPRAIREQLHVTGDDAQRLRQVMGCDVGELLELGVGPLELGVAASELVADDGECLLGRLARADVDDLQDQ